MKTLTNSERLRLADKYRSRIMLRLPTGSTPLPNERRALELIEMARPWVACIVREACPPVIVCGDTRADMLRTWRPARPGPNGPIDCWFLLAAPT